MTLKTLDLIAVETCTEELRKIRRSIDNLSITIGWCVVVLAFIFGILLARL